MGAEKKQLNAIGRFFRDARYQRETAHDTLTTRKWNAWNKLTGNGRTGIVPIVQAMPFLDQISVEKDGKSESWSMDGGVKWLEKLRFFYLHQINFPGKDDFIRQIESSFFQLLYHDVNPSLSAFGAGKAKFFGEQLMEPFVKMVITHARTL